MPLNRSNDDVSRCGIKRAGGFVEDQCTGWRHKGPCKCNALALTTRKVSATFANVREYAIWQLPNKQIATAFDQSRTDFLIRCGGVAQENVVLNGTRK